MEEQPWEVKAGTTSKPNLEENLPVVSETRVQSLGREDPLGKGMATRSSVLAWRIPWTEQPGGPHSSQGRTELDATDRLTLSHSLLVLSLPGHWDASTGTLASTAALHAPPRPPAQSPAARGLQRSRRHLEPLKREKGSHFPRWRLFRHVKGFRQGVDE